MLIDGCYLLFIVICSCLILPLSQEYQKYFHNTKQKLERSPSERQFDFSEMYIFGKFDTFQRRLNKILAMFNTISTYSALQDSKIEGLETTATRFQVLPLWHFRKVCHLLLGLRC